MEPMTTPQMQPAPSTEQQPPTRGSDGVGPVVAIIVIVLILALGGIYYLMQEVPAGTGTDTAAADQQNVDTLISQGSSDTAAAIQADISATDLTPVDQAVAGVDAAAQ